MAYWMTSLALIVFGLVAGFSIGLPFFLVGVAMLLLGRIQHRALIFWPPMLGFVAFNLAYWLTVPFYCSGSSFPPRATCASLSGISWPYDSSGLSPSPDAIAGFLGLLAAFVTASVAIAWLLIQRQKAAVV
jgi:hypothetical protein